ncbi:MAG: XdhC family protein [Sphaerochaetaceae bacterium]|nr:XdhC family protein [Sphaerochaetaceae bacterium]MDC7242958.1 XdhC family protein [Sphaerochaetaceae bacterium]
MSKYFSTLLENLNNTIERRTRLDDDNLGKEAIYDSNNKLLISNTDDFIEKGEYLSENLAGKLEIVMCGGGHVGLAVYNLALLLDWKVTIIEDRSDFCTPDKFPKANLVLGNYDEEIMKLDLSNAAVIIATRGHKFDKTCLEAALLKQTRYVGMIGSKAKVHTTKKSLYESIDKGESQIKREDLDSIFSPIGININAQTPEEIAIAIVAEIIKFTKSQKKQIELDVNLLRRLAKEEEPFVVARIVEKRGSAPREQGSYLAVFSNGEVQGTIGGGAVEARVIEDSKKLLKSTDKKSQLFYHNLSNTKASELGMICGGNVKVLITKFIS